MVGQVALIGNWYNKLNVYKLFNKILYCCLNHRKKIFAFSAQTKKYMVIEFKGLNSKKTIFGFHLRPENSPSPKLLYVYNPVDGNSTKYYEYSYFEENPKIINDIIRVYVINKE